MEADASNATVASLMKDLLILLPHLKIRAYAAWLSGNDHSVDLQDSEKLVDEFHGRFKIIPTLDREEWPSD